MSYVEQSLVNGEKIEYRAQPSKARFIFFGLWAAFCLLGSLVVFWRTRVSLAQLKTAHIMLPKYSEKLQAIMWGVIAFVLAVGLVPLAVSFLTFITSEFVVTNKRVMSKVGILRRRSVELLLGKVEGIIVNQGILGRMLGYGTIVVTGIGGGRTPFKHIADPLALRRAVQDRI